MKNADVDHYTALARGLSGLKDISVEIGDTAHYNQAAKTISLDRDLIGGQPPEVAAALITHEVGHVLISRYFRWQPQFYPAAAWWHLMNALEDPRVDRFMQQRYPGSRAWFALLYGASDRKLSAPPRSYFLQFTMSACLSRMGISASKLPLAWPVRRALERTAASRERHCAAAPMPHLRSGLAPAHSAARGAVEADPIRNPRESLITDWAEYAIAMIQDEIVPIVEPLLTRDLACVATFIARHKRNDAISWESPIWEIAAAIPEALEKVRCPRTTNFTALPEPLQERLRDAFGIYLNGQTGSSSIPVFEPGSLGPYGSPFADTPRQTQGDVVFRRVSGQAEDLTGAVAEALRPLTRQKIAGGYASGATVDMGHFLRYKAARRDARFWQRRSPVRGIDAAVSLLVDLSGSMAGPKTEAAAGGAFLLAEALWRNAVPFAIDGFQDVIIPFARPGENDIASVRDGIAEMPLEVEGRRPGGNNNPSHNDDGPCLVEAAAALLAQKARQKLLIVISDGMPNGKRSTPDDLHAAVASLSAAPGFRLIGLGLGPETEHVHDFYPDAISNIPLERLGAEIGELLIRLCKSLSS